MSNDRPIAVIGGGISGLVLGFRLATLHGISVHIFDTGRKTFGGRCSSRTVSGRNPELDKDRNASVSADKDGANSSVLVDHAAQLIFENDIKHDDFRYRDVLPLLRELEQDGVLVQWCWDEQNGNQQGCSERVYVGTLRNDQTMPPGEMCGVVPSGGMGAVPQWFVDQIESQMHSELFLNCWISSIYREKNGDWSLWTNKSGGGSLKEETQFPDARTYYSHVIFAHCGKCASRLVETSNVKTTIAKPLQCRFVAGVPTRGSPQGVSSDSKLDIVSQFSLTVGIKYKSPFRSPTSQLLRLEFDGSISDGPTVLKSATNNSKKYDRQTTAPNLDSDFSGDTIGVEYWTLLSTSEVASAHKCPQEAIPNNVAETVTKLMIEDFVRRLESRFCGTVTGLYSIEPVNTKTSVPGIKTNVKGKDGEVKGKGKGGQSIKDQVNQNSIKAQVSGNAGNEGNHVAISTPAHIYPLHLQLWGAALPLSIPENSRGFLYDTKTNLGVVGDWLLGANIPSAMASGILLADFLNVWTDLQKESGCRFVPIGSKTQKESRSTKNSISVGSTVGKTESNKAPGILTNKESIVPTNRNGVSKVHDDGSWKWAIRRRVWDYMEKEDVADNPRPVHNRIPNFKKSQPAGHQQFARLDEFKKARIVKINPDTPQKGIRILTMEQKKTLLVPSPRLLNGFFSVIEVPSGLSAEGMGLNPTALIAKIATSQGAKEYGRPLEFDCKEMIDLKVDLIVIGSVAVDPLTGARIGKGEGFAELEYGLMRLMGNATENTPVITFVHDCQVLKENEIPLEHLLDHDVCVDKIVTPTRVIDVKRERAQPTGIYWHLLSPQKMKQVRILYEVKKYQEKRDGKIYSLGVDGILPERAVRHNYGGNHSSKGGGEKRKGRK